MNWLRSFWKQLRSPAPTTSTAPTTRTVSPALSVPAMGTLTPRAQQVLALARQQAVRFNHHYVGTEHLLLGITELELCSAAIVLVAMGIDLKTLREEVERQLGQGPDQRIVGNIPYTPRVKKVLALALRESKSLDHTCVGTEHLLLGLLEEGDGVAARVLSSLGVNSSQARSEVLKHLSPNPAPEAPPSASAPNPPKTTNTLRGPTVVGDAIDTTKRYDVYCTEWGKDPTIYKNVRLKAMKHLFPRNQSDTLYGFVELELPDGECVLMNRHSVVKLCENKSGADSAS